MGALEPAALLRSPRPDFTDPADLDQSLGMAFPTSRFMPADSSLELRIPAQLTAGTP
jgi:hypothetical protein